MGKVSALWNLFKVGQVITDPAKWKQRQITATVLAAVILAAVNVVKVFGYDLPIDTETANAIAGGIIAAVNVLLTVVTTDKIGLASDAGLQDNGNTSSIPDRPSGLP